jgi:ribosome-associated protein
LARLVRKKRSDTPAESEPAFLPNVLRIGSLAAKYKAIDMKAYNVQGLTLIADALVVCSAASEPQLRAIFDGVREGMKEIKVAPIHTEGVFNGGWLVIDYGNIIFHVFRQEAREFYDIDGFWGDAPLVDLGIED